MARHRNIRNLDLDDERLDDLEFGRSFEDTEDVPFSPTQNEFIYQRKRVTSTSGEFGVHELSDFVGGTAIKEGDTTNTTGTYYEEYDEEDYYDEDDPHGDMFDMDDVKAGGGGAMRTPNNQKGNQAKAKTPGQQQSGGAQSKQAKSSKQQPTPSKQKSESSANNSANRVSVNKAKSAAAAGKPEADMIVAASSSRAFNDQTPGIQITAAASTDKPFANGRQPFAASPPAITQLKAEAAGGRSASSSRSPVRRATTPSQAGSGIKAKSRIRPSNQKPLINLVVVGHVDAGKSTLMGHVLYQLGNVNKRVMAKYQHDSQKSGKASFAYAWVLDETEEERSRGVTMDIGKTNFETLSKRVVLLDAPGHKDFIPNMITGAAQADAAILVVNATRGEFETGFDLGGQTREHAMLLRSLGVSQMIIVVNKMDTVDWSKSRFDEITIKIRQFLAKQAGWPNAMSIASVPVSGLNGINLTESVGDDHPLAQWYNGPTLVNLIDNFSSPERLDSHPLRLTVSDVFKGQSGAITVAGMVETGSCEVGDRILLQPHALSAVIRTLQGESASGSSSRGESSDDILSCSATNDSVCYAGDSCLLTLTGANFESVTITPGCVICHPDVQPIEPITRLELRVVVFDVLVPITRGYVCELHAHNLCEPVVIKKLKAKLSKSSGAIEKEKPRCLPKHTSGIVEVQTSMPVCLEAYQSCKQLGRVTLRSAGKTIAAGIVQSAK